MAIFLGLINNALASYRNPGWGGWGGRYIFRQPTGGSHPIWTQGGDSYPGSPNSRDTMTGVDGKRYTSDQATIWRWREAFQHDFSARMDWTMKEYKDTNHNPVLVVNGDSSKEPILIEARVGAPVILNASGTKDPDEIRTQTRRSLLIDGVDQTTTNIPSRITPGQDSESEGGRSAQLWSERAVQTFLTG